MKPIFIKVQPDQNPWHSKEYAYDKLRASGYRNNINHYAGVYILWSKHQPIYIGKTKNMLTRLVTHMRGQSHLKFSNNEITGCTFLPIEYIKHKDQSMDISAAEKHLIGNMKPERNVQFRCKFGM